jgi:hypothetical protein
VSLLAEQRGKRRACHPRADDDGVIVHSLY